MISRYEVVLNGESLAEIDENLLILDVNYPDHEYDIPVYTPGGSESSFVDEPKKGKASVSVSFELHVYGIAERQEALQKVIRWCKDGGVLQINDRPEQRLNVICEKIPALGSVRNWTDPMEIVFSAYGVPYWQDDTQTVATLQGSNTKGTIAVPGNVGNALFEVTVTANAAITYLTVTVGSNTITLDGISCPVNGKITLSHDKNGILSIKQGTQSLLSKRKAESSDDIKAACGANSQIGVAASGNVKAVFSVRGCWL